MAFDNERATGSGMVADVCEKCGLPKLSKIVVHSVHDGLWPKSGSGEVRRVTVSWCDLCEPEPISPGPPIVDSSWSKPQDAPSNDQTL